MARRVRKLTAAAISGISEPGRYSANCHGLALLVRRRVGEPGMSMSWSQRIRVDGKATNVGLGPYPLIAMTMAKAHATANAVAVHCNEQIPYGGRRKQAAQRIPTFAEAAEQVIAMRTPTWKPGSRNAANWRSGMQMHAYPRLGKVRVDKLTTADVLAVLMPIWSTKAATAKNVRRMISAVMEWARAHDYRSDNPADSRIDGALPANGREVAHRKALPHKDVPTAYRMVAEVQGRQRGAALGLMFLILTGARRDEARGAAWNEVDLESRTWTIQGGLQGRMKAGATWRVPLSDAAVQVLQEARALGCPGDRVFCGARGGQVNETAFLDLLRKLGIESDVHGFRSSLRDFIADAGYPDELGMAANAHALDKTEAAYKRTDLLERRRPMMQAWGEHVSVSP